MPRLLYDWLHALALLRHPEVRKVIGGLRFRQLLIDEARRNAPGARLADGIEWIAYSPERFRAEAGATVGHGTLLAFGDEQNGFGRITIGRSTWIGQYNNLRACEGGDISIGADCLVSQFCTLVGSNHRTTRGTLIRLQGPDRSRLGVSIEDDVWIGSGVALLPGVVVGKGAVIGANSVVTKDVPPYEIWAGSPARRIRERA
jgi:acetyltransferase-like isoleucine patch superfamily enzyme